MQALYNALVANKQKAIVGFVVAWLVAYFSKHGIDIDGLSVREAIELVIYGILGYVSVFVKRNQP